MRRLRSLPPLIAAPSARVQGLAGSASGFARADGRSSAERGYGADWRKVRAQVLAAEPCCRRCASEGRATPATDVDHIEPFHGLDDPRRLDPANLRPLCRPCHMARTARQAHRRP